ncbi:choice-of-anchor M domain-containing protein [Corynebacterium rhinophilum]|uniref:choice-of-anchor M domain-containing protein n=1 Tax=Corynebacterium rhinophilum TaxID=3050197 RepID=UPI0025518B0E|nr:choice-of-anchor M domain-containing protein [Corynebacterium sp. MSK192]MDK8698039.1 choice-of-anchor M domain-containing protein [Corynebacterium sp. MSK192]
MASPRIRFIAAFSTIALIAPATAYAGPDDGKHIATQTHVDSPKSFWENDNFLLRSEFSGQTPLIDDTVAWIGKGYNREDEDGKRRQNFMYSLPENGTQDYIGPTGTTYYTAPYQASANQEPIWIGFGADTGLPVKDFRDNIAFLDLLSVDGPGDVELFTNKDDKDGAELHRMLGSFQDSPHSTYLNAGTHTHNATLFTKPGRYRLTYRTTARTADGQLVASEPQTTSYQVGGQKPKDDKTPSLKERFDSSSSGDAAAAGYSLSMDKKQNPEKDGDDKLTTISFDAENKASGTLTLLIDGYFLTDLPVADGHAEWDEYMGLDSSNIQAVFTPEGDAPRWISQQVEFTPGSSVHTDSSDAAEAWEEAENPRQLAPTEEVTLQETGYTVRMRKQGEEGTKIIIDMEDNNFSGVMTGGLYENKNDEESSTSVEAAITKGHGEATFTYGRYSENYTAKINVFPHSTVQAGHGSTVLTESYKLDENYEVKDELSTSAEDNTATPGGKPGSGGSPAPGDTPAPFQPPKDEEAQRCSEKQVLDRGHVDIKALPTDDGFRTVLRDDTGQIDKNSVDRSLDDVVLGVHKNALTPRGQQLGDKKFDFLGNIGDRFYHLPQTQNQAIIWPGYNTEELDYSKMKNGKVNLNLKPTHTPEGAEWGAYIDKARGVGYDVLANSAENDHTIETTFASHRHTHWAFTKPGIYTFEATYTATTTDGKELASEPQTLTFAIGDDAVKSCSTPAPSDSPSEKPSETPSEKPSDTTKPSKPSKPSEPSKPSAPGGSSFNPWTLVLPAVLGITFKAFYNFFRDNQDLIRERFGWRI